MAKSTISALIADPSSTVRLSIRQILQGLGVERVETATSIAEARRKLIDGFYDVVLCEYNFNDEESGQDLLEDLRRKNILAASTIFIVLTAERNYSRVVGVAEEAPDEYLLKPVVAGDLEERIEKAFARRNALIGVYDALHRNDPELALRVARQIMSSKSRYMADAARLSAQILFRLRRYDEASRVFQALLATRDLAWAKFGLARVSMCRGDEETAEKAMCDIIAAHMMYLPVYNQLADLYLSQERFEEALGIVEQALQISPNSVHRLQLAGQLAFTLGDNPKATAFLEKALRINSKAVEMDYRTLLHMILLQIDNGNAQEAASLVKQMGAKVKAEPGLDRNPRGEWYRELALAFESLGKREPLAAIDRLQKLSRCGLEPELDFDFLLDYLVAIDRLFAGDIANTLAGWLRPMLFRFNVSRQAHDLMVARVARHDTLVNVIKEAGDFVNKTANEAARKLVENNYMDAADMLVEAGQRTRNNRLLLAAANAAAKCVNQGAEGYRTHAEACLSLIQPPASDGVMQRVMRSMSPEASS